MTPRPPTRMVVLAVVVVLACSGCVTTQATVAVGPSTPAVFEGISTTDAWGTSSIQASVALTPDATTSQGVTRLSVVNADGGSFYATSVSTGQTSVTLPLPTGSTATIVATNTVNGTTVGTATVTVGGNVVP